MRTICNSIELVFSYEETLEALLFAYLLQQEDVVNSGESDPTL